MEISSVKNQRLMERVINKMAADETLDDLTVEDVFIRCLEAHEVAEEERQVLTACYNEIIQSLHEADANAE